MARRQIIAEGTYGMVRRGAIIKPTTIAKTVQPTPRVDVVRLKTGEQVATSEFNQLTIAQQAYLRKFGVDAFNKEQARVAGKHIKAYEQAEAFVKRQIQKQERWYGKNIVEVGKAKEPILKSVFNRLSPTQQNLLEEKGVAQYNKDALAASMAQAGVGELTGEQLFRNLQNVGGIPSDAVYKAYDPAVGAMGEISYILADGRSGRQIFNEMKASGKIDKKAVFEGYTPTSATAGQIRFSLPETMTPREQFTNWKASDPTAPSDAVFEGSSPDGGFMYSSPSVMQLEVETATGKVTMPMAEWEAKSAIKQYELVLGRIPTLAEWQGYRLMEAGVDLPWWKELIPGMSTLIGNIASFIPGEITEERYNKVQRDAQHEWQKVYPWLKWEGVKVGVLEELGFSAAKALYPQITVKDVTGKEWALTGLNIALWFLPVWLPKAVKGVKVLIPNKLTARLRTVPFSEKPGLQAIPGKAKVLVTTKTIGPAQVGMSSAQFKRFVRARVANPKLTPDIFKVLDSVGSKLKTVAIPAAKRLKARQIIGIPRHTYPRRVGARELTKAEWLGKWKPSTIQPSLTAPSVVSPGWAVTKSGKYMPVGAQPISLPDVPVGLVIRSPIITGTGKVITPITSAHIAKSLGLTTDQVLGKQPLTKTQLVRASQLLGITQSQVATVAKQGKLEQALRKQLTTLQSKLEGLTSAQAITLMKSLTKLQTQELTQTQMQSLATTMKLNMTDLQSLLANMEELQPVAKVSLREFQGVAVTTRVPTKMVTKKLPTKKIPVKRPLIPTLKADGEALSEEELAGAVAWKQGFIYKLIYPPYGQKNIMHSRKSFPGVKTLKGADSAYKTIVALDGKLPKTIKRDMGIMDIDITTTKAGKPRLAFFADPKQETQYGVIRKPRTRRHIPRKRRQLTPSAMAGG